MTLRLALVGVREADKTAVANYLDKKHGFKIIRLDDPIVRFYKNIMERKLHQRVTWETRVSLYDALYKVDPNMQVDFVISRVTSPVYRGVARDIVVPDARYLFEIQKLTDFGFKCIRVSSPPRKELHLKHMRTASPGILKLIEHFGVGRFDNYPVEFSVYREDIDKFRKALDIVVRKMRQSESGELVRPETEESIG